MLKWIDRSRLANRPGGRPLKAEMRVRTPPGALAAAQSDELRTQNAERDPSVFALCSSLIVLRSEYQRVAQLVAHVPWEHGAEGSNPSTLTHRLVDALPSSNGQDSRLSIGE